MSAALSLIFLAVVSVCRVQLCHGQAEESSTPVYNGTWHNQLGSYMNLILSDKHFLNGTYHTVLATEDGSAVAGVPLVGFVNSPNSTFGFTALWEGHYAVTWNGEYKVCNDVPVLFTTFTLKPPTASCRRSPQSTRIGQDCFTRFSQMPADDGTCPADQPINPCNTPC